ncbi:MAG: FlgK family flagellar hook-associated protein, partial [Spartobacteria bacterium]
MAGLISSLHNSSGALRVHSKGLEITGKNLANVNNRGYSKERVEIGDRGQINTGIATESMGVEAMGLRQNRDALLDKSVMRELTTTADLEARQKVLRSAEVALGQFLDRTKDSTSIQNASGASGGGISDALTDFFNAWESVSVKPNDVGEKQLLIEKAKILAEKINLTDKRLAGVQSDVDSQIQVDVGVVNQLLKEIAENNDAIAKAELVKPFSAVDLRDQRQAKLEELSKYIDVNFENITPNGLGQITVKSGNLTLVNGKDVAGEFSYSNKSFAFDLALKPTIKNGGVDEIEIPDFLKTPADTAPIFGTAPSIILNDPVAPNENGAVATASLKADGKLDLINVTPKGSNYTSNTTAIIRIPLKLENPNSNERLLLNGKLNAQLKSSVEDTQIARDEIASLADQITKSVNIAYSAVAQTDTRFFSQKSFATTNIPVTVPPQASTTNINLASGHNLQVGDQILLVNLSANEGVGLTDGKSYYIKSVSGVEVQLSETDGGPAVSITSSLSTASTFRRVGDPLVGNLAVNSDTLKTAKNAGGNGVALEIANLANQKFDSSTDFISGSYTTYFNKTVTTLAQQLNTTNTRLEDQKLSEEMAVNSRDQYSGVSQDE